jgi:signal transduction histidine kinase
MGAAHTRRIEVRARALDRVARVEVADTGPGLAPELKEDLFDPYVRHSSPDIPGLGLGLATVRRIVRLHGGEVDVVFNPSHGCVFWFELPLCTKPLACAELASMAH